jgi:hypothetical protein
MHFDWVIFYFDNARKSVVIDNFYDCMFPLQWEVETIGL